MNFSKDSKCCSKENFIVSDRINIVLLSSQMIELQPQIFQIVMKSMKLVMLYKNGERKIIFESEQTIQLFEERKTHCKNYGKI